VIPGSLYFRLANLYNTIYVISAIGPGAYIKLCKLCRKASAHAIIPVAPGHLIHPFHLRPGTTDLGQYFNTVLRQPYDLPLKPGRVKVVIDAGANIGHTACWYASKFPAAQIIALEPDPSNFAMLVLNARPYGDRVKA